MQNYHFWIEMNESLRTLDRNKPKRNRDNRPLSLEAFKKSYNAGEDTFNLSKDTKSRLAPDVMNADPYYSSIPWYLGFDAAAEKYFEVRYGLAQLQSKIRKLVEKSGLEIDTNGDGGSGRILIGTGGFRFSIV